MFRQSVILIFGLLPLALGACTMSGAPQRGDNRPDAQAASSDQRTSELPIGSRLEASGYLSIATAPPTEFPKDPPPAEPRTEGLVEKFARENGYTLEEARGRINGSEEMQKEIARLAVLLKNKEAGNFVDMRMVRDPAVTMIVTFKRDAAATLRKYTAHPDFRAVEGGRTEGELRPIADRWIQRLDQNDLQFSVSTQPDRGQIEIDLGVTRQEFEVLANRKGWSLEPEIIWTYASPQPAAFTDPALAKYVRIFPRAAQSPLIVLTSLTTGTIALQDGCFRLKGNDQATPDRLVLFGRDVQLTVDDRGYLAIRTADKPLGRIGERMGWGGYGPANEQEADVIALRKACGDGEIVSVGTAESMQLFSTPYPAQIDEYARKRKLDRNTAWRQITQCLTKNGDARFSAWPLPEKDCYGFPTTPPPPVENPADCPEGTTHSYGLCRDENGDSVPAVKR